MRGRLASPTARAFVLGALQLAIALSVAGTYLYDRATLPRVWARTVPVDPDLPIRGRYVRLWLAVTPEGLTARDQSGWHRVQLSAEGDRLVARPAQRSSGNSARYTERPGAWTLTQPVAFFISEHVADPSCRAEGEELWAEVSVPRRGPPRPVRLGVRRGDGAITPLELR
ncbi:MAG TPA: hypothetical protein VNA89_13525 [Gemmatimonadaceae bacterium]|nr:hypothetical protein [Gemmatimonadaceae bacterium]